MNMENKILTIEEVPDEEAKCRFLEIHKVIRYISHHGELKHRVRVDERRNKGKVPLFFFSKLEFSFKIRVTKVDRTIGQVMESSFVFYYKENDKCYKAIINDKNLYYEAILRNIYDNKLTLTDCFYAAIL